MAIKNYWWLIIWMFLFGGISISFIPKQEEYVLGRRCVRWNWLPAILLVTPYILWAGFRSNSWGDTGSYQRMFANAPSSLSRLFSYVVSQPKDRGFAALQVIYKTLISRSSVSFFCFIAIIQLLSLVYIYRRYSRNLWLSIFFFVASTDYLSWMHNGSRQFLAAAIIFAGLPLLIKKRYVLMAFLVLLASQIHLTALIFLPFIFVVNGRAWNIRTLAFIFGLILSVLFLDRVTGIITDAMRDSVYSGDVTFFVNDDGTNILRVLFYSVPAFMAWLFRPYIDRENDPMINICANLSIVAAGFYFFSFFTSGVLVGRIPIYFSLANYILIPWLITEVFDPASAVLIDTCFVGVYTLFFYIQCRTWKLF